MPYLSALSQRWNIIPAAVSTEEEQQQQQQQLQQQQQQASPSAMMTVTTTMTPRSSPPGRIGHIFCANEDGSKAYMYGGVNDRNDTISDYLDDLWEYDLATKTWLQKTTHGNTQPPRAFHSAVWYKQCMYIFGGCNGRGRFNRLFSIDADGLCTSLTTTDPPLTRYCHSAVLFEGGMYVFGGKCGGRNSNKRLDDLFVCTLDNPMWSECPQLGDVPPPRSAHTALTHERTMMIFGGRNANGECCEDFYMYHFDTHVWRRIDSHQSPLFGRARHSAVVHHGNVVVFAGWNGKKKLNDLFIYNVEANTYDVTYNVGQACPSRRECHLAVMCRDTMVIFGGRFRGVFIEETTELYLGPRSAADSARDWIIAANMPKQLADRLPLRLRETFLAHDMLCRKRDTG